MSQHSFSPKLINVGISLGKGNFQTSAGGSGNSMTISGLRVQAKLSGSMAPGFASAHVAIYGMKLATMNQLTVGMTQYAAKIGQNKITLTVGDIETGMSLVFSGMIATAFVDASAMPQVCFRILAQAGYDQAAAPATDSSYQGKTKISQIAKDLAGKMKLTLENAFPSGFDPVIDNPHLHSAYREQMHRAALAAGIDWTIEKDKLVIMKPGTARQGGAIDVNKNTILIGYPSFNNLAIVLRTRFDPALQVGAKVNVQSDLTPANGTWVIGQLEANLESMVPRGRWEAIMTGILEGTSQSDYPSGED